MSKIHGAEYGMVYVTATDVAKSSGDKLSCKEFSIERGLDAAEVEEIGTVLKIAKAGHTKISLSVSGELSSTDAVLALVRNASLSGATIFPTVLWDPAASAGSQGARYGMIVTSYSEKASSGGLVAYDAKFELSSSTITAV